jgi:hypothetical protein
MGRGPSKHRLECTLGPGTSTPAPSSERGSAQVQRLRTHQTSTGGAQNIPLTLFCLTSKWFLFSRFLLRGEPSVRLTGTDPSGHCSYRPIMSANESGVGATWPSWVSCSTFEASTTMGPKTETRTRTRTASISGKSWRVSRRCWD